MRDIEFFLGLESRVFLVGCGLGGFKRDVRWVGRIKVLERSNLLEGAKGLYYFFRRCLYWEGKRGSRGANLVVRNIGREWGVIGILWGCV